MTPRQRKNTEKMLPKGFMDDSYAKHEVITTELSYKGISQKIWETAQKYKKEHPYNRKEFEKTMKAIGFLK